MKQIANISDEPKQSITLQLDDGSIVTWQLEFRPQQYGWFYQITWNGLNPVWSRTEQRLVANPNILRTARLVIPFGIAIATQNNGDPQTQDAFSSGYATAFVLNATDVAAIEAAIFPGPQ